MGGIRGSGVSTRVHSYSPAENRWRREADLPTGRGAHAAAVLGGHIYVLGGLGDDANHMLRFDPADSEWTAVPGPTPREHLTAVAVDGRLFAIGGRGYGLGVRSELVEVYEPAVATWVRLADLPVPCAGCAAAATSDGLIHVVGGEGDGRTWDTHQVYDPVLDEWTEATPLPSARHGIAAAALGSAFFVIGGGSQPGISLGRTVQRWVGAARQGGSIVVDSGVRN